MLFIYYAWLHLFTLLRVGGPHRPQGFFGSVLVRWWNLSSHATGQRTQTKKTIYKQHIPPLFSFSTRPGPFQVCLAGGLDFPVGFLGFSLLWRGRHGLHLDGFERCRDFGGELLQAEPCRCTAVRWLLRPSQGSQSGKPCETRPASENRSKNKSAHKNQIKSNKIRR